MKPKPKQRWSKYGPVIGGATCGWLCHMCYSGIGTASAILWLIWIYMWIYECCVYYTMNFESTSWLSGPTTRAYAIMNASEHIIYWTWYQIHSNGEVENLNEIMPLGKLALITTGIILDEGVRSKYWTWSVFVQVNRAESINKLQLCTTKNSQYWDWRQYNYNTSQHCSIASNSFLHFSHHHGINSGVSSSTISGLRWWSLGRRCQNHRTLMLLSAAR